ncbi:MAG TPA: phytanoyl-CoA dioxygenase family protein [Acidimicrobiia bacterium]|nr:phytanoyl-CoA dioxygenase family protein [Acidimicrobiia bacterium]
MRGVTESSPLRPGLLGDVEADALASWADVAEAWPVGSHVWGQYAEQIGDGVAVCRTENVSACHPGVAALVDGALREAATEALGEPATAFKDKINYKHPGGAGFRPHQDRLAYPGVDRVLSVLVAIDECTTESGCLWLAGGVDEPLPTDDRGVVRGDLVESLRWEPAELAAGDAVLLDGLAPHYSEANRGDRRRRVLVASYAPASEGYSRGRYYSARADTMRRASQQDGRFRISTLADFDGIEVAGSNAGPDRCTHDPVEGVPAE